MIFLGISLLLLFLAISARWRTPKINALRTVWFISSLLPSELPWVFGAVQSILVLILLFLGDLSAPRHLSALLISSVTLVMWYRLHRKTYASGPVLDRALSAGLGADYQQKIPADSVIQAPSVIGEKHWLKPFSFKRAGVERLNNISYGQHPRQKLDIYRLASVPNDNPVTPQKRPVLLYVHGGGWVVGSKHQQGQPLLNYMARNGWICVDINYRLSPKSRFPDSLVDVKTAIAWLKQAISQYGGDPDFIAISGGSAGGHLCALAALTPNLAQFQPGFEQLDTSVQAAVPIYGVYDFTNSGNTWSGKTLTEFVQRLVMPSPQEQNPALWQAASPIFQIQENAPPMMLIHGTTDALVFVEEARTFASALAAASHAPCVYAELPGAQHGFDLFHAVRTEYTIEAIGKFLYCCHKKWLKASVDKSL